MVGTGILSNNMRSPSLECITTFWMMTIYSDTLHWSGITPIFDPITDLDLITECDFLPNCERFPQNICNECGMPTEDAYFSWHLAVSYFGTCKCSNVETNLSWTCLVSGFCVSNSPRYFCFAFNNFQELFSHSFSWIFWVRAFVREHLLRLNYIGDGFFTKFLGDEIRMTPHTCLYFSVRYA